MDKEQSGMIIIMVIFYFVFFHINVSLKKRKTLSVSGNVTFLFFQVRHLNFFFFGLFSWLLLYHFTVLKERHKIVFQREKNSNIVN